MSVSGLYYIRLLADVLETSCILNEVNYLSESPYGREMLAALVTRITLKDYRCLLDMKVVKNKTLVQ